MEAVAGSQFASFSCCSLAVGDNDRFHMETVHHSEEEIERILRHGGKIDRTAQYAVDDEDEEYEQYHGFGMTMMM